MTFSILNWQSNGSIYTLFVFISVAKNGKNHSNNGMVKLKALKVFVGSCLYGDLLTHV